MSYDLTIINDTDQQQRLARARSYNSGQTIAAIKAKLSTAISASNNFINPYKWSGEALLGVDITPSCIYVCQIDNSAGSRALTGLASVCMAGKFVGEDILNNPNLYSENLKKLIRDNHIKTRKVAVSLPVSSSIIKVATISKMHDADIERAIKYGSLWQNLMSKDDAVDNYSIFYQVIRRDEYCDTMDILLVATKLADIKLYKDIVMKSGLNPVIIDAKSIALHYAMKNRTGVAGKHGTVLVEFGLDDNHVMVMGDSRPRVFNMDVTENERAAILGHNANGDGAIIDGLIAKYSQKINSIIKAYGKMKPEINVNDICVMSALPLIDSFVSKLSNSLENCQVRECSMFDYLIIGDNFTVSKESAKNNISAWAGAISMAIFPWQERQEQWIEIRKSPSYGTVYRSHKSAPAPQISMRVGEIDPFGAFEVQYNKSTLARLAYLPAFITVFAAIFCVYMMSDSYSKLEIDSKQLAVQTMPDSDYITKAYNNKIAELAKLMQISNQLQSVTEQAAMLTTEENQRYVLSMYNYLDKMMQQGVWLRELNFIAPNEVEIVGRAVDDKGVITFLDKLNSSKFFTDMALKHMQSISELDLYSLNAVNLKSFKFKGRME